MPYDVELTREEYNRMVAVTLECSEPDCGALRGELCRSLIVTSRNNGFTKSPHYWRRLRFTEWKKDNPERYQRLVEQVLAQRTSGEVFADGGGI